MNRRRNPSATVYEGGAVIFAYRHDRGCTEETAVGDAFSDALTDDWDETGCGRLLIDHADCHFVCDDSGDGFR